MWLKGYAHAPEVREAGLAEASVDGSADEIRYWRIHQPIVTMLLRNERVRVACPIDRAGYENGQKAVILGYACTSPERVHWVGLKRSIMQLANGAVAAELMRDLLGESMLGPHRVSFDLMDVRKLKLMPETWRRDRGWINALRILSTHVLDGDELFMRLADGLFDDGHAWDPKDGRAGDEEAAA